MYATFTDFMHFEIPDEITLGGIAAGIILSLIHPPLIGELSTKAAVLNSLLGIAIGGGSIYLTGLLGKAAFKKEAMGFGDVKLMGAIGAFLGWKLVLLTFFMAPFFGSIIGIYLKIKHKQDYIPYGPYLSLAALVAIFLGNEILRFLFLI